MKFSTQLNKYFANWLWNPIPQPMQFVISKIYGRIYKSRLSKFIIAPFCTRYNITPEKLSAFEPASGADFYQSFQDFFSRRLKLAPALSLDSIVWPCQGHIVDFGAVKDLGPVNVKGEWRSIQKVFGDVKANLSSSYFVNIFLHNHHYHRVHSPVSGRIVKIERIAGKLTFLRPWLYKKKDASKPSLVNERVVLEIRDQQNLAWYVAIVGGMGVGTIVLDEFIQNHFQVNAGDEIAHFLLGSTVCLATPYKINNLKYMKSVMALEDLSLEHHKDAINQTPRPDTIYQAEKHH